jgi:hypothetical protein
MTDWTTAIDEALEAVHEHRGKRFVFGARGATGGWRWYTADTDGPYAYAIRKILPEQR